MLLRNRFHGLVAALILWPLAAATGQELINNGGFDDDILGWEEPPAGLGTAMWSGDDVAMSPTSGSAIVMTERGQGTGDSIKQCVAIAPGESVWATAQMRVPSGQMEPGSARLIVQFFSGAACEEATFLGFSSDGFSTPTDTWRRVGALGQAPPSSATMRLNLVAQKGAGGVFGEPFEVHADDASVRLVLFVDGFESGGTGAWSATTR